MKKYAKILVIVLCLSLILAIVPLGTFTAGAESTMTLAQLQAKFPAGYYWNHYVSNVNQTADNLGNNKDNTFSETITKVPCDQHGISDTVGHYDCNYFAFGSNGGWQCRGFALKLASLAYGGVPYTNAVDVTDVATAISVVKPGDVLWYKGADGADGADWTNGHWVFITQVSGSKIKVGECNYGFTCKINWDRWLDMSVMPWIQLFRAPSTLSTGTPQTLFAFDVNVSLDGTSFNTGSSNISFDVIINGTKVANDVKDYAELITSGATYAVNDIKVSGGYYLSEKDSFSGTLNADTTILIKTVKPVLKKTETFNNNTYEFYSGSISWENANKYANDLGGHLATVTSKEENDFICNNAGRASWLGATDKEKEGTWKWVTGEKFEYKNWASGQPDNASSIEHYLTLYTDKTWNDLSNYYSGVKGFVVEFDCADPTSTNNSGTTGDCTWTLNGTELTISGNGEMADYTAVPHAPWGDNITKVIIESGVTNVGNYAFNNCTGLTSVTIPNSVTSIGEFAFCTCSNLTSITIPSSVTSIGECAFYGCSSLTSITIPSSVTSIGEYAFACCVGLNKVNISDLSAWCNISFENSAANPLYCAGHLYLNDKEITDLIIPNNITCIGDNVFAGYTGLTSVIIPNSVTSIGKYAFYDCSSLTSITIPNSVTSIGTGAFYDCVGLTSVTIPNSVTSIGKFAFDRCVGLTSITIPSSVTSIGNSAFYGCVGLNKVNISDLSAWCNISFEDSAANPLYCAGHLYLNDKEITDLIIPNNITCIGDNVFADYTGLTSVTIPNSVTSIGKYAFYDCHSLESITIPDNVISIGDYAFCDCYGITSIIIPNSVTSIGSCAFCDCINLAEVINFSSLNITAGSEDYGYVGYYAKEVHNGNTGPHIYDNDCDTTCNVCGATRAITHQYKTVWSSNGTQHWHECSTCGDKTDIEDHIYDNDCDTTCNVCNYIRSVGPHIYDNDCDTTCNVCGATRAITHQYKTVWSSDATQHWHECSVCGDKSDINNHIYDNDSDADCNVCGAIREITVIKDDCPQISVESKTSFVGKTVTLDVKIKNNPGFTALNIALLYDKNNLTLKGIENGITGFMMTSDSSIVWDGGNNFTSDGTIATLTFEIGENAEAKDYEIKVRFFDASNYNGETVEFEAVSGILKVLDIVYGDANGDGNVSTADLTLMRRYFASRDPESGEFTMSVSGGADANGDGKISTADLTALRRYFASRDPETGIPTYLLGPKED